MPECVEVLQLVFGRLPVRDLSMACCCCRAWRDAGYSEDLWRALCRDRWPGSHMNKEAVRVIKAMGGYRLFYKRRILSMRRPPRHLQIKPWLRPDHLTFFLDLTYEGSPLVSEVFSGSTLFRSGRSLDFCSAIEPAVVTHSVLPRQALTPLFYQGQLFYEKPFQPNHAASYSLNWSVVRSTDHRMACILNNCPIPDGLPPWKQNRHRGDHEFDHDHDHDLDHGQQDQFCVPLFFQSELVGGGGGSKSSLASSGVLRQPPLLSFACFSCCPVWGKSLNNLMHFKLVEIQLGVWHRDDWIAPPPADKVLLSLQELDWK